MTDEDCERELVMCRDGGAPQALAVLDLIRKRQRQIDSAREVARVQEMLDKQNKLFHDHADIDCFMLQYSLSNYGKLARFLMLVLLGSSLHLDR